MAEKKHVLRTGERALRLATIEDVRRSLEHPLITDQELATLNGALAHSNEEQTERLRREKAVRVLHDSLRITYPTAVASALEYLRNTTSIPKLTIPEVPHITPVNRLEALVYAINNPNIDMDSPLWKGQLLERQLVDPTEEELANPQKYLFVSDPKLLGKNAQSGPTIDAEGNVTLASGERVVAVNAIDKAILKFVGSFLSNSADKEVMLPSLYDTGQLSANEQNRLERLLIVQDEKLFNIQNSVEDMHEIAEDFAKYVVKMARHDAEENAEQDTYAEAAAHCLIQLEAMRVRIYAMLQNSTREEMREARHKHHIKVARQITKEVLAEALYDKSMPLPAHHDLTDDEAKRGVICVESFFNIATSLIQDHLRIQIESPRLRTIADTANELLESGRDPRKDHEEGSPTIH